MGDIVLGAHRATAERFALDPFVRAVQDAANPEEVLAEATPAQAEALLGVPLSSDIQVSLDTPEGSTRLVTADQLWRELRFAGAPEEVDRALQDLFAFAQIVQVQEVLRTQAPDAPGSRQFIRDLGAATPEERALVERKRKADILRHDLEVLGSGGYKRTPTQQIREVLSGSRRRP